MSYLFLYSPQHQQKLNIPLTWKWAFTDQKDKWMNDNHCPQGALSTWGNISKKTADYLINRF